MTAAFAAGQIAGPLLVRALGADSWVGMNALGVGPCRSHRAAWHDGGMAVVVSQARVLPTVKTLQ